MSQYEQLKENFEKLAKQDNLSHAYLFFGEPSLEKLLFTCQLANFLEKKIFGTPKEFLHETLLINVPKNVALDLLIAKINPEENRDSIGIEIIRVLKNFLWRKPVFSKYRLLIINSAEKLTLEAQNSLLKILEEPPPHCLLILISHSQENLLPTLISRMQTIYFHNNFSVVVPKSPRSLRVKEKYPANWQKNVISDSVLEKIIANDEIDKFFEAQLAYWRTDLLKNSRQLKELLRVLTIIKQRGINKRLQLKALFSKLSAISK